MVNFVISALSTFSYVRGDYLVHMHLSDSKVASSQWRQLSMTKTQLLVGQTLFCHNAYRNSLSKCHFIHFFITLKLAPEQGHPDLVYITNAQGKPSNKRI